MSAIFLRIKTVILILCFAVYGCENSIEKIKLVTGAKELPVESVDDMELLYSDSAMVKMKLTAPKMDRYDGSNPFIENAKKGMNVIFFNDEFQEESRITSNYARRYEKDGRVITKDNVVVVNKKGEQLNTEELI